MTSSARDLRYGRRGGRWAEPWTDDDEARYQAAKKAKAAADEARAADHAQGDLFAQGDDE